MERNPYASPANGVGPRSARRVPIDAVPAEPDVGLVDVVEQAGSPPRSWRLALSRDEAWLYLPAEQSAFAFTHAELAEQGNVIVWGRFVALVLNGLLPDGRAIAFKIEGEALPVFRRWIHEARDLHVANALKHRLRAALPIGLFAALIALPILGPTLDPFGFAFGVGLVGLALVGPRHPRPTMLLADALVWWALAASQAVSAYEGSKLSIAFAILAVFFGRQSLRMYTFYR